MGQRAKVSPTRPGGDLRWSIPRADSRRGVRAGCQRPAKSMADPLRAAAHRYLTTRLPRSVIALNEHHLRRVVARYLDYYHDRRTHLSLSMDAPNPQTVH